MQGVSEFKLQLPEINSLGLMRNPEITARVDSPNRDSQDAVDRRSDYFLLGS